MAEVFQFLIQNCKIELTLLCPKLAGETLGRFCAKEPNNKNLALLQPYHRKPGWPPTYTRGAEKIDIPTSLGMRLPCVFFRDWAILCPKPVVRPATAGPAGLGHKIIWIDLPKQLGPSAQSVGLNSFPFVFGKTNSEVFQVVLCPVCILIGSPAYVLKAFFKGKKQILCPRPAGEHQLLKKPE